MGGGGGGEIAQFCRGPEFDSQHQHDVLQPPLTPFTGDPSPSSDLCVHQTCMWFAYICLGKTLIHINKSKILLKDFIRFSKFRSTKWVGICIFKNTAAGLRRSADEMLVRCRVQSPTLR